MTRLVYISMMLALLLSGCASATEIPVSTNVITVMPSETSISSPPLPATESPTKTPIVPTATFAPLGVVPISAHPLTLTEFNAGTEMKRLNVIGTGTAHDLEFSPDGKLLAIATGRGIYLYDGTTFEQNGFIDVNDSVSSIAFSPDGNILAVAVDGDVSLWNVFSGKQTMSLDGGMVGVYKLAYSLGGYVAAIGGNCRSCGYPQQAMILWDTKTGKQVYLDVDIGFFTIALLFTPDGKQLFYGGGGIKVIETETGRHITSYTTDGTLVSAAIDVPYDFVLNNDSTHLFVTSYSEESEIFDFTTQTRDPFPLCQVNLVSNGNLGLCSKEEKIVIFDLASGTELQSIEIDIDASSLGDMFALSPDSNFLVYYGKTGANVIDIKRQKEIAKIQLTDFGIAQAGVINVDGVEKYVVATLTYSGQIEVYDIQTGDLIRTLKLDCCEIKGFNFAPDHKTFATVDVNKLRIWDLQTGGVLYEIDLEEDFSGPISYSPDGMSIFLAHIAEDYVVEIHLQSGNIMNYGRNGYPYDYADPFAAENYHFNEKGNLVMLGYEENNGKYEPLFIDAKTDQKLVLPMGMKSDYDFIEAYSFSPKGEYLAVGNPTDIFVWNTETLKLQARLTGHEERGGDGWFGKIRSLDFNPQSNLLVSIGWDGTIRLWSARFGNELRRLNICCSVDFTPDGRYLIIYGDGVASVWGIP